MKRVARYETLVYPSNRHSGCGVPVTVYAENVSAAKQRAIQIGWGGHPTDALVAIQSIHDTEPESETTPTNA